MSHPLQDKYARGYRERVKQRTEWLTRNTTLYLIYFREKLTEHLSSIDDDNVSDAEFKETVELDAMIRVLEADLKVLRGKRVAAYAFTQRAWRTNSPLFQEPPPPPPPPAADFENLSDSIKKEVQNILRCAVRIGRRRTPPFDEGCAP